MKRIVRRGLRPDWCDHPRSLEDHHRASPVVGHTRAEVPAVEVSAQNHHLPRQLTPLDLGHRIPLGDGRLAKLIVDSRLHLGVIPGLELAIEHRVVLVRR